MARLGEPRALASQYTDGYRHEHHKQTLDREKKITHKKAKGFLVHRECLCVCAREFVRERQKHNMREIVYPTTQKQMKSSISAKQNVTREHAHTHMHARAHEYQDALLVMCTQCFTLSSDSSTSLRRNIQQHGTKQ